MAALPPMSHYAKVTLTVAAVLVALAAAWAAFDVLILAIVAGVLALGLNPAVRALQRLRLPRGAAIAVVLLLLVAFIVTFAMLAVPPLVREAKLLATQIPQYLNDTSHIGWLADLEERFNLGTRLEDLVKDLPSLATASFASVLGFAEGIVVAVLKLVTILFLTLYLLAALPRSQATLSVLFSPQQRERSLQIATDSFDKISAYVAGKALIALIAGGLTFVALKIIGIPYSVALGMFTAIADLIPVVGGGVAALVTILVALFSSPAHAIAVGVFFTIYLLFENHVLIPRIMSRAVDLSTPTVIIVALVGASLAGLAGALLAIPLTDLWLARRAAPAQTPAPPAPPRSG
jgi:predicted PurR-regulated permease PerM